MKKGNLKNRILLLAFALLLAIGPAGCARNTGDAEAERNFFAYYLNEDEDQIRSERFEPRDTATDAMIAELVLLQKQPTGNKKNTLLLPEGTEIESYLLLDGTLTLEMDASYAELPPTREILARAGLVRTFTQVEGVFRVAFTSGGKPIVDSAGNEIGALTAASFLENAGKEINAYQLTSLKLYFSDERGETLIPEVHSVYYTSNEPLERVVVEELMRGPSEQGHYPVIAPTANLLSVTSQDKVCYVNFEASPASPLITADEEVQVWALVNSLVENCGVDKVQFSIGGKSDVAFLSDIMLDQAFERNNRLIREE